jgi:transcriptional regulator with XRE-family HTH domain
MSNAGSWLRERREELHFTRSGVERLTSVSADRAANERYRIRRGRLTDLEEGRSAPDIFEVASLSECYKVTYPAVLRAFGMKLGESGNISHFRARQNRSAGPGWSSSRPFQ